MHLTEYETTVVIRPDIGGDAVEGTLDRFRDVVKASGGKLLAINHWGKKKLAYEIKKHARGIYIHTHYLGASTLVHELERNLRISDNVLRYLTVRLAQDVALADREEKEYVRPQYDADDAATDEAEFGGEESEFHEGERERRNDPDTEDEPTEAVDEATDEGE